MATVDPVDDALAQVQAHWSPAPGYLDAASMGLPPRGTVAALAADLERWQAGAVSPVDYDPVVARAREAFARLVAVGVDRVAVGHQVSELVATVAAGVPDGAHVLAVEGEFTSVVFPFLAHADRGVTVERVARERLADAVRPGVDVVAFALCQSSDGVVLDADAVRAAARDAGALVLADLTQAAGWLPVDAADFDVTVTGGYKWLCSPRGSAFLTVAPGVADRLRPVNAGWFACEEPWSAIYAPDMELAASARRFDVSPAWPVWVGTAESVALVADLARGDARHRRVMEGHGAALADAVLDGLGMAPRGRPVLSLPDPDGGAAAALRAAGCRVASRAGGVRISFHVWSTDDDAARVVTALRGTRAASA